MPNTRHWHPLLNGHVVLDVRHVEGQPHFRAARARVVEDPTSIQVPSVDRSKRRLEHMKFWCGHNTQWSRT